MAEYAFEHADGFEQGELGGQVRLGKFEAHYEEIFAEVIEDDLPPAFMKNALLWAEGLECSCC